MTTGDYGIDTIEDGNAALLAAYMAAWIDDIADALLGVNRKLYRQQRRFALTACLAGIEGKYHDPMVAQAAEHVGAEPQELYTLLYSRGYARARGAYAAH